MRRFFDAAWVERALRDLRPDFYAVAMQEWQEAAPGQREAFLLRGQALREAEEWARPKRLSDRDTEFLALSRELEKRETEKKLRATEEANILLAGAERQARRRVRFGSGVLVVALVLAAMAGTFASTSVREAEEAKKREQEATAEVEAATVKVAEANQQVESAQKQAVEKKPTGTSKCRVGKP
ncbi:MAG: hypothetical protein HC916_20875 [Coleofasciculaceae cyanobacterium SM2_1_6]|nr:hypothetical protein [Coleofasciculaceae cyanobacterium SM2_1_6]